MCVSGMDFVSLPFFYCISKLFRQCGNFFSFYYNVMETFYHFLVSNLLTCQIL